MTSFPGIAPGALVFPDDAGPSRYRELLRDARASGRCPVWFGATAASRVGMMDMPADPIGEIDAADPAGVLAGWAPSPCPPGCTCLEPFTEGFPSDLVRSGSSDRSQEERTFRVASEFGGDWGPIAPMGVVEAARPADVPAVLAWGGIGNYPHQDLVGLSAVLRSWEERFGAVLVLLGPATLVLSVADPPRTRGTAERVAAEHFAFCPDQHDPQDGVTVHTPRTYARMIRGARSWRFWWD